MNEIIFIAIVFVILFSFKIYIQTITNPKISAYIKCFAGLALIILVWLPTDGEKNESILLSAFGVWVIYNEYLELRKLRGDTPRQSL